MERRSALAFAARLANALDRVVSRAAVLFSRIALPLMIACGAGLVIGRHLRVGPTADLKELESVLFFGLVMLSFGYGYLRDAHVRIDLLSRRLPARARAAIELAGCAAVLLPFCLVLMWYGGESAWRSFLQGERLPVGDLPLQWLVRLMVPLGALALLAASVAVSARCLRSLLVPSNEETDL
jgi:TRAP-type mannitol/chloroaromatic compound transport system permease small subunit